MVKLCSDATFKEALNDAGDKLVLVDFFAEWCGPCKAISPKLLDMEKEFTDVVFLKIDVDESSEVAEEYEVSAMPTFIFIKNGKQIEGAKVVGASEEKIREAIKNHK